jgi:hypothetical protein
MRNPVPSIHSAGSLRRNASGTREWSKKTEGSVMGCQHAGESRWVIISDPVQGSDEEEYGIVLERVQKDRRSLVGNNYYFIRVRCSNPYLCRIPASPHQVPREETLDHECHGISDHELEEAIRKLVGDPRPDGCFQISGHIERKIRVLLEFE